jgi:hypothetical protein
MVRRQLGESFALLRPNGGQLVTLDPFRGKAHWLMPRSNSFDDIWGQERKFDPVLDSAAAEPFGRGNLGDTDASDHLLVPITGFANIGEQLCLDTTTA